MGGSSFCFKNYHKRLSSYQLRYTMFVWADWICCTGLLIGEGLLLQMNSLKISAYLSTSICLSRKSLSGLASFKDFFSVLSLKVCSLLFFLLGSKARSLRFLSLLSLSSAPFFFLMPSIILASLICEMSFCLLVYGGIYLEQAYQSNMFVFGGFYSLFKINAYSICFPSKMTLGFYFYYKLTFSLGLGSFSYGCFSQGYEWNSISMACLLGTLTWGRVVQGEDLPLLRCMLLSGYLKDSILIRSLKTQPMALWRYPICLTTFYAVSLLLCQLILIFMLQQMSWQGLMSVQLFMCQCQKFII